MSDTVSLPVGSSLRAARESQGLTQEEVAGRLRLMHRQIAAMEREDFSSLGQPVFARGFVRNYARLLGLDPEPLLAHMGGAPIDAAPVVPDAPPPPTNWLTSPWVMLLLLGGVLLVTIPVALYWWLNSDAEPVSSAAPVVVSVSPTVSVPLPPDETRDALARAAVKTVIPAESNIPVPVASEAVPDAGLLQLEFGGESWVEVKDASGRAVIRQLNQAGNRVAARGQPPFDILIGNAAQVRLSYNGRPIDLKPFIDVTVARFTLEE